MLFRRETLEGIVAGRVDLAFRRWVRPQVRAGGVVRTAVGVIAVREVEVVAEADVSEGDARRAGFADRGELFGSLREGEGRALYRLRLGYAGTDPRAALREEAELTGEELAEIVERLGQLDARSRRGPWTTDVLALVAEHPGVRAADLAAQLGRERLPFKADVRRLKEYGLTESLEVGYRLSPRGVRVLDALRRRAG